MKFHSSFILKDHLQASVCYCYLVSKLVYSLHFTGLWHPNDYFIWRHRWLKTCFLSWLFMHHISGSIDYYMFHFINDLLTGPWYMFLNSLTAGMGSCLPQLFLLWLGKERQLSVLSILTSRFVSAQSMNLTVFTYLTIQANGGFVMSASHNPGGPDYDWGIKV